MVTASGKIIVQVNQIVDVHYVFGLASEMERSSESWSSTVTLGLLLISDLNKHTTKLFEDIQNLNPDLVCVSP